MHINYGKKKIYNILNIQLFISLCMCVCVRVKYIKALKTKRKYTTQKGLIKKKTLHNYTHTHTPRINQKHH